MSLGMSLGTVQIGQLRVSRLVIGGNPFSGISHQSPRRDREMRDYYTVARIKETMQAAERLGINTFLGRADRHIMRTLVEYWNEGGAIQWLAQTTPELSSIARSIDGAIDGGARAVYLHGGQMDNLLARNQLDEVAPAIARIRAAGLSAGIAGHQPAVFHWAEQNLDVDFYMCSYYNPSSRASNAEHVGTSRERFADDDRERMVETIQSLSKPVIHYKIFAAGRNEPRDAFTHVARHLRPTDAVCIGVFPKDNPKMIEQDIALFEQALVQVERG